MDPILVFDKGKIVEEVPHSFLKGTTSGLNSFATCEQSGLTVYECNEKFPAIFISSD